MRRRPRCHQRTAVTAEAAAAAAAAAAVTVVDCFDQGGKRENHVRVVAGQLGNSWDDVVRKMETPIWPILTGTV